MILEVNQTYFSEQLHIDRGFSDCYETARTIYLSFPRVFVNVHVLSMGEGGGE